MSPDNLIQWLRDPALLDENSLKELKIVLDAYPCFVTARVLYLKNLLILNDLRFSDELIRTAISVPDRRRLFYFMEDKPFPEPVFALEKEIEGGGFSIIDRFLNTAEKEPASTDDATPSLVPDEKMDLINPAVQDGTNRITPDESDSKIHMEGNLSLDYMSFLNQGTKSCQAEEPKESMPGQELIDAFLDSVSQKDTRVAANESEESGSSETGNVGSPAKEEIAENDNPSIDLPDDTFTETLAKIYIKQKRYDKAIEIFRSLSLKYPEKNVYFADQLRYLEKLIYNIKKD